MGIYYTLTGLAFQKGLENFESFMPKSRVSSLLRGCQETKGFKWCEFNFINWIICVAGREERKSLQVTPTPVDPDNKCARPICKKDCNYLQYFNNFNLQKNALRMETASFIEKKRCGWNLKANHIGGNPLDYGPCYFK